MILDSAAAFGNDDLFYFVLLKSKRKRNWPQSFNKYQISSVFWAAFSNYHVICCQRATEAAFRTKHQIHLKITSW